MRDLTRLVDLPELREAPHLALVVAPRSPERGQAGRRDVGRVNLDERVDEVLAERPLGGLALEPGRRVVRRDEAVEVRHHVERDAEQALVLTDGDDRRQPAEARFAQSELQPRLSHDVVGRRWQRRARRAPQHERACLALEQKREVGAAALTDPSCPHLPRTESVLVEKPPHPVEHEERGPGEPFGIGDGLDDVARQHRAILRRCAVASTSCATPRSRTSPRTARPSTRARFR